MISITIFPGRYIQGAGAIQELGQEMARWGRKGLVLCDPFIFTALLSNFRAALESELDTQVERCCGECSDEEIERLSTLGRGGDFQVIAGVGGGKTLDTAKAVANGLHLPVVVVPTIASTDAPCSALSVIYTPAGEFKRYQFHPANPNVVLVDTEVIAHAPVRLLVAGMGDALATWFEAESCQRTRARNMTGRIGSMTAYSLARLCYDTLLADGVPAKSACEGKIVTPALERVVEANTLLSGLGFESGGLAAAHAIHNGLSALAETHHYYHGEKVAVGTLASLFLTGKPGDLVAQVYSFCEAVGLPTSLSQIGLAGVNDEELLRVAQKACAEGETIHNEPVPVNPYAVLAALRAMDAEGTRRR
jgi:glycerol dehydrogenase